MVIRNTGAFDGTLNGNSFRLVRGDNSYSRDTVRSILPFFESAEVRGQYTSRQDVRVMHQTNWADGAFWNKPLISESTIRSYYDAEGMDMSSKPGSVIPSPDIQSQNTGTPVLNINMGRALQVGLDEIYYMEATGGNVGLWKWDGSTFSLLTNDFGLSGQAPYGMCWDAELSTVFAIFQDGSVRYLTPDSAGGLVIDIDSLYTSGSSHVYPGTNIFKHDGRLLVYNGDKLIHIEDPLGSPVATIIHDDGLGPDYLSSIDTSASPRLVEKNLVRLAIPSSEGIWIIKNHEQEGLPIPSLTRVDRNQQGTNLGIPLGDMMTGQLAIDMQYHLGSVLVSASTEVQYLMANDFADTAEVTIFHYRGQSGFGTVGSPMGPDASDFPCWFVGVYGPTVLIGGVYRIWAYDSVNGGLHPWQELQNGAGPAVSAVQTTDDAGVPVWQIRQHLQSAAVYERRLGYYADTGQTHRIESNFFDFNLPAEPKSLTHVTLMTDGLDANETIDVFAKVDGGNWTQVASFDNTNAKTEKVRVDTVLTGYRFEYRLDYTTSASQSTPVEIKGIIMHALQGELVTSWDLVIDGKEFRNVEGQLIDPADVKAWLKSLAALEYPVTYVDGWDGDSSYNVKVDRVRFVADTPDEFQCVVRLTEDV